MNKFNREKFFFLPVYYIQLVDICKEQFDTDTLIVDDVPSETEYI